MCGVVIKSLGIPSAHDLPAGTLIIPSDCLTCYVSCFCGRNPLPDLSLHFIHIVFLCNSSLSDSSFIVQVRSYLLRQIQATYTL